MIKNKQWYCIIHNTQDYQKAKLILEFNGLKSQLNSYPTSFPLVIVNGNMFLVVLYESYSQYQKIITNWKQIDLSDILKHQ